MPLTDSKLRTLNCPGKHFDGHCEVYFQKVGHIEKKR